MRKIKEILELIMLIIDLINGIMELIAHFS